MIEVVAWAAISAALLGVALWIHGRCIGWLPEDAPRPGRKRHARPTPMAGMIPALLSALILARSDECLAAGAVAIATAIGWLDDATKQRGDGVAWTTKALALGGATLCACLALAGHVTLGPIAWTIVGVGVFVLTNATNFLDNQDGVASGLGVTALAIVALHTGDPTAVALIGAWVAFVPFNWPEARLFLGDGGALPLGTCIAFVVLRGAVIGGDIDPWLALAPVVVLLVDFTQVVTARIVLGYAPWIGDRRHITHVLLGRGVPRRALAPLLVAVAWAIGWPIVR